MHLLFTIHTHGQEENGNTNFVKLFALFSDHQKLFKAKRYKLSVYTQNVTIHSNFLVASL